MAITPGDCWVGESACDAPVLEAEPEMISTEGMVMAEHHHGHARDRAP